MPFSNVDFFNAFVGMCYDLRGRWPNPLYRHGYRLDFIEPTIAIDNGDLVNPEILVSSDVLRNSLAFEWKTGANTEANQNARNARLRGVHIRSYCVDQGRPIGYLPSCTYVYACNNEFFDRIVIDVDANGYPFPILSLGEERVELRRGRFVDAAVTQEFTGGLALRMREVPGLISFDLGSSDVAIALELLRYVELRFRQERVFEEDPTEVQVPVEDVLSEINPLLYSSLAGDKKAALVGRLQRLLQLMAKTEFRRKVKVEAQTVTIKVAVYDEFDFNIRADNYLRLIQTAA